MEITQTPPAATAASVPQPAAAKEEITSDFETFLRMLTVQMQNQDPLNPVESSDFAVQLATFSTVEQAVLTNDLLQTLTTQLNASGLAGLAEWVGKEARAPAPVYFLGEPIPITPDPAAAADRAEIVVRDANGSEVQRLAISASSETIDWAGVTPSGAPLENGLYSFDVVSYQNDEVIAEEQIETYNRITEVRNEGTETRLILEGGGAVSSDDVTALREPGG